MSEPIWKGKLTPELTPEQLTEFLLKGVVAVDGGFLVMEGSPRRLMPKAPFPELLDAALGDEPTIVRKPE